MIGTTLGHYRVLEKIGAGGMGVVYRAHDEQLDRDVALKVLPPGTLSDEASRKRIRKEALALSKLNHPNIATVDVRSDIWAAGAVLYEMATGHRAFSETQYPRLVDAILNRAPRRPTELNPEISPGLENIILRALEKEPARRYQSARELLIAQEQLQVSSRSVPGIPRPRIPRRLRDPSKKLLLAAGFLALLLASWLGWRSWVAHTSTRPHPLVFIAEFENRTGEAVFDQTLQELIATALEQSHFVSILPRSRVQDALVRMERLPKTPIDETIGREICQREGLQAHVLGSISRLGDRDVLLARAESPSGQNLASVQDVAPGAGQVLAQLDGIVQRLRT